jgi:hypothetical protein
VDALAPNRDDFFRHAIEEKIARVHGTTLNCWTSNVGTKY